MKNKIILFALCLGFIISLSSLAYALETPFEYNIIPQTKNNSVIDTNYNKFLTFNLFEYQNDIYYNGTLVDISNNSFTINVSTLLGKQDIVFKNSKNETSKFTYYFSNKHGKLLNYELVAGKNLNVFVKTYNDIQIIYTDKERNTLKTLEKYIDAMPDKMKCDLKSIKMIPYSNTSNIAGSTKNGIITLYNFSKYDATTQKNIIFHETAHTWANKLMDKKVLDYDYTKFNEFVNKDNNFVSKYSKNFADSNNGRLSEDFADSVAFYLINSKSFKTKYPNRAEYIENLFSSLS